ncbi:hypothetical protein DCAR_0312288 [Daucus carota subsp. sativus]|uniref:Uncharacterized protein n=1 Tax=Daucus carota subsp. sativus TaxID=79200 RepID=A0A166AXG1_DAUCS|nr:PREDICTED: putative glycosyltransferase 7 [Daucus carota subsp. sativus]XP_017242734.1 PREDICTED: putative glycosyltransferase 7 [Daucus carota subsp. sativus]WOG93009.1 hypothetical protein DCAR_0312288 [Daucus carota subsp. sativus]
MVSSSSDYNTPQFQSSPSLMANRHFSRMTTKSFSDFFVYVGCSLVALLLVWALWSFSTPTPDPNTFPPTFIKPVENEPVKSQGIDLNHDSFIPSFYDDPTLMYTVGSPLKNWDEKRSIWLSHHPSFAAGAKERIMLISGSQSTPCKNPMGDHLLLRFFKNKVDYCRIHGYDIFYNNILLQPKMFTFWAKIPAVRAAMVAHPEAEWIWWVDSDAAITDMDFKLPLNRYKDHNLVVHGWPKLIYEKKSWTSLNAGVFLIRNCQWSLDFMEVWASMGPQNPNYEKWGATLRTTFKDKIFPESDDQSGLVYLLLHEKDTWGKKIYVEGEYYFEGYWLEIVENLENVTRKYNDIEKGARSLRRRHAEKVSERYGEMWEDHLKDAGNGREGWRRPFITHFTGCQPCSGDHNMMYSRQTCWGAMEMALNFADNQVLRNFGFVHNSLSDSSKVSPLPFDYPASEIM